jgi:hypothetical protein
MCGMSDEQNLSPIGEMNPHFLGLAFKATCITYLSSRQSNFRHGEKSVSAVSCPI